MTGGGNRAAKNQSFSFRASSFVSRFAAL